MLVTMCIFSNFVYVLILYLKIDYKHLNLKIMNIQVNI